jgi:formate hydrogenlyase subunit 6/NADH:ubiquinone oxidoreductase subunit I
MDNLLNLVFKAANVEPRYEESLCLAARKTTACSSCRDACPHEAITIRRKVEIDKVDCSGCGLCVQACPTQALQPRVSYQAGASLRCSRVKGTAQSVHCLGRLQPTDVLRLVGSKEGVTLARGNCGDCPIGNAAVAKALDQVRAEALELAGLHYRTVTIEIVETDRLDDSGSSESLSRRELLRGGWRGVQQRAGELLAPLDPGDEAGAGRGTLPTELQRRYRMVAAAKPRPETLVPWSLPRVSDICIMCPACTKACPTGALERVFESGGDGVLQLKPDHCMACEACVTACPVGAVTMDEQVTWGELSGGVSEAYRRDPQSERPGSVSR